MSDPLGNNANFYTGVPPYPIDGQFYTTLGGEFQNSASPYGTFDQGGNLLEWNETAIYSVYRGIRGGSFVDTWEDLLASTRRYADPTEEDAHLGFRVVSVPEPTSISLLVAGALGLLGCSLLRGRKCIRDR